MTTVIRTSTKDGVTIWHSETCTHVDSTVDVRTDEYERLTLSWTPQTHRIRNAITTVNEKPPTTCQR